MAHATWRALKSYYEPANALTAIQLKQEIISYCCSAATDPLAWCEAMVELYSRLQTVNPRLWLDQEFAKHLVTLMTTAPGWRYC
jgi:hypothetical protein